jgi:hypothetical protein
MKPAKWIFIALGLLLISLGLDRAGYFLREWTSRTLIAYPLFVFRIGANLVFMSFALAAGLSFPRKSISRPLSILMLAAGLLFLLSPLLPVVPLGFLYSIAVELGGFIFSSYSSLAGALLLLLGALGLIRSSRSL